jgi:hypothetical protein
MKQRACHNGHSCFRHVFIALGLVCRYFIVRRRHYLVIPAYANEKTGVSGLEEFRETRGEFAAGECQIETSVARR